MNITRNVRLLCWVVMPFAFLLTGNAACWGQDATTVDQHGSRLFFKAQTLKHQEKAEASRALLEVFADQFPKSRHRPYVLQSLAQPLDSKNEKQRNASIRYLRLLLDEYPVWGFRDQSEKSLKDLTGYQFNKFKQTWRAGSIQEINFEIHASVRSDKSAVATHTLYRIPSDVFIKALQGVDVPDWNESFSVTVPRSSWKKLSEQQVTIPRRRDWARQSNQSMNYSSQVSMKLDFTEPGIYVLEQQFGSFKRCTWMRAMSFAVAVKHLKGRVLAATFDPWARIPVPNIVIELRVKGIWHKGKTGPDGMAWFNLPVLKTDDTDSIPIIARRGDETQHCWVTGVFSDRRTNARVYITTDRPLYRPGQTVHFKATRRDLQNRTVTLPKREKVRVRIETGSDEYEKRTLQTREYEWNEHGTLSGTFELSDEPLLGTYSVVVEVERRDGTNGYASLFGDDEETPTYWSQQFAVSAYRKPEYSVNIAFDDDVPNPGQKMKATLSADYYFGGGVKNAKVKWHVIAVPRRQHVAPWPRAPFGDPLNWYVDHYLSEQAWQWYGDFDEDDETHVAEGQGELGADGKLAITFDTFKRNSFRPMKYTVHAEVTDVSYLSAEGEASFVSAGSALAIKTGVDRMFYLEGETIKAKCRVTTHGGEPAAGAPVSITALYVPLDRFEKNEDEWTSDSIEYESYFKGDAVADKDGLATVSIPARHAGPIRLIYRVTDKSGQVAIHRADLYVEYQGADEAHAEKHLKVIPDKAVYTEGETIRVMVRIWQKPLTALLTIDGAEIHEARIITLDKYINVLELPAKAGYAPNVAVKLSAWNREDLTVDLSGGFEFYVYPKERIVEVEVSTDRLTYGPSDKARIKVVTRVNGKPAPAEVELGVVDEAIFALMEDLSKDLRVFFIASSDLYAETGSPLPFTDDWSEAILSSSQYSGTATASTTLFGDDDSADQSVQLDTSKTSVAAPKTRKIFADTMLWAGHLKTGADGVGFIEVRTPDNLTKWRMTARAVAGKDRFGVGVGSTVTTKNVIVRLSAPRFYRQGDRGTVATVVHNYFDKPIECTVSLTANGATITNAKPKRITVPPHSEKQLTWALTVEKLGDLTLHAKALSARESDAMELTLPVKPRGIDQFVSHAGVVEKTWQRTCTLPKGAIHQTAELELYVAPGATAAVTGALPFLAQYPYGCVEQTMSRFLPAVVAKNAMDRLGIKQPQLEKDLPHMVKKGLSRLVNFQHEDGGWGWWHNDESHPRMTAYVVFGLATAHQNGFEVPPHVIVKGVSWLQQYFKKHADDDPLYAYALNAINTTKIDIKKELDDYATKLQNAPGKVIPTETWAYLIMAGRTDLAKFLPVNAGQARGPKAVYRTALIIRALVAANADEVRLRPHVKWLMGQRRGGQWHSTIDTAYAVFALASIKQPPAKVNMVVTVNGQPVTLKNGFIRISAGGVKVGDNEVIVSRPNAKADRSLIYASAVLRYFDEHAKPNDQYMTLTRTIERYAGIVNGEKTWTPLKSGDAVKVNEELRMNLRVDPGRRGFGGLQTPIIEAPIAAGSELSERVAIEEQIEYGGDEGRREFRDDRFAYLPWHGLFARGTCFIRPTLPGEYYVAPAVVYGMYDPDKRATTTSFILRVTE